MNKIIFISDFYVHEILGGGEKNNDAFLKKLKKIYTVEEYKSINITLDFLKKNTNNFLIVANFFLLKEELKHFIKNNMQYLIYEHDHKYVVNNNPSVFENFDIPDEYLINLEFYSNARAVLCQSKMHSDIVYKNTLLQNLVNLGGNFWSDEDLNILLKNINNPKTIKNAVINSTNKNKGTPAAVNYCLENNIKFDFINFQNYESFIENLSRVENLIFFPQWVETYNRMSVEARILNCKITTNKLIGASSEDYFKLKGTELLDFIRNNNNNVFNKIISVIENKNIQFYKSFEVPKLTFITSLYKGKKFIKHFLENITSVYLFNSAELLIYDSDSPEDEYQFIEPYLKKYKNISYKRLDKNYTPSYVLNLGIRESSGVYLTTAPVDDRIGYNFIRHTLKNIHNSDENLALVYGDCLQTRVLNETLVNNSSQNIFYEHSLNHFSRENMIKCLPGPMPVWKKEIHKKIGYFDENIKYPIDWEMWLRMVKNDFIFKKINKIIGLYFLNENGLTTSLENSKIKNEEEAKVFFKYEDIFGKNFLKFKDYFSQFIKNGENDVKK